jgi:hypothetical protein
MYHHFQNMLDGFLAFYLWYLLVMHCTVAPLSIILATRSFGDESTVSGCRWQVPEV